MAIVILGLFNSTSSLEVDLGAYSSLTNGETYNLAALPTLAGTGLTLNISGTAYNDVVGGLGANGDEIVTTTTKVPATVGTISGESSKISTLAAPTALESGTNETPSGANFLAYLDSSSTASSFKTQYGTTSFGFGTSSYALGQTYTGSNSVGLYDLVSGNAPVEVGTFTFSTTSNDTTLTYNTLSATPEPSAYALGLCALALFWVLKRRSSTVA